MTVSTISTLGNMGNIQIRGKFSVAFIDADCNRRLWNYNITWFIGSCKVWQGGWGKFVNIQGKGVTKIKHVQARWETGSKVWSFCDNVITECHQCNFPEKIFYNFSYKKFILKCWNYGKLSGLWSFACSINFKIRQIPSKNHFFENNNTSSIKPTVVLVKISKGNVNISDLKSVYLFQSGTNNSVVIWALDAIR